MARSATSASLQRQSKLTSLEPARRVSQRVARRAPDWAVAEQDYRAGILTLREIGSRQGVTHTAVGKRAKRGHWTRDLAVRVRRRADEKFSAALSALTSPDRFPSTVSTEVAALDAETVESHAEAIVRIRLQHKASIKRCGELSDALFAELASRMGSLDACRDAAEKATELAANIKMFKDLTDAMSKVVRMETRAFRLDEEPDFTARGRQSLPIRFVSAGGEDED